MPVVGVQHGLECMVIAKWKWDKLVVMSEALHIPSIDHVMDHALHYHVAGWAPLHCVKNVTSSSLGFNSNHQTKDSTSHFEQHYLTLASLRIGRTVNYQHEMTPEPRKSCTREEGHMQCPVSSFLCNTCFLGVIQKLVTCYADFLSALAIATLVQ